MIITDSYWDENKLIYICIETDENEETYEVHISEEELIKFPKIVSSHKICEICNKFKQVEYILPPKIVQNIQEIKEEEKDNYYIYSCDECYQQLSEDI